VNTTGLGNSVGMAGEPWNERVQHANMSEQPRPDASISGAAN
jgi:hypothetical protein